MDNLTCSLSQIVHLCNEATIFLHQLSKFEHELEKFSTSTQQTSTIVEHFALILNDLNIYYENDFLRFYFEIFQSLSRKYFTVNYTDEITVDFLDDLKSFNQFLRHRRKPYRHIFDSLHRLNITCWICIQYRQLCTNEQLAERFVSIRIDLLDDLRRLNDEMRILLMRINNQFTKRIQSTRTMSKTSIDVVHLLQTIFLWFVIFLIISYFSWPLTLEMKSASS